MNYKEISNQTGLKINHVKQILKGKRKATIKDMVSIKLALRNSGEIELPF